MEIKGINKMRNELYFCLELTENEHYIVENELTDLCLKYDLKMPYYRRLKDGDIPCFREIKITGKKIGMIKKWIEKNKMVIQKNPHKEKDYWLKKLGVK